MKSWLIEYCNLLYCCLYRLFIPRRWIRSAYGLHDFSFTTGSGITAPIFTIGNLVSAGTGIVTNYPGVWFAFCIICVIITFVISSILDIDNNPKVVRQLSKLDKMQNPQRFIKIISTAIPVVAMLILAIWSLFIAAHYLPPAT